MAIRFHCDNSDCGKALRVKDEAGGTRMKCPACGRPVVVPQESEEAPADNAGEEAHAASPKRSSRRAAESAPQGARGLWLAGLLIVLVLAGGATFYLLNRETTEEPQPPNEKPEVK